ncbi:MAG: hypothetical protein KJ871_04265 [Alphaproteobacteria bacterium]|nr:hypothetical protein [Alphaproteobacteria bacterium]MBU2082604.1 hypothetical protein [Alphaproteobacteria bacterium]MBU2142756.1 hypothetical protein [Alphaproteobacteria bacterium]MBU2195178.1 hypothetical protein [Alphaproteobacteria bacterium]
MSKEPVEEQMRRFLMSDEPEAICITGLWGVGKTYLWENAVLPDAKRKREIKLDRYSYVSLFGINDLDGLRQAIFANSLPIEDINKPYSIENSARQWSSSLAKIAEVVPYVGGAAKHIAPFLSMTISKQIVCFDDLERKGSSLSIRDVLGLVTFLKEQRQCQVIVLTNSGDLTGDDEEQFNQYLEKVFDRILVFDPTPEYCAQIAIDDDKYGITDKITTLRIANIRIIFKIRDMLGEIIVHLTEYDAAIHEQAVRALVLACWIKYAKGTPTPKFLNERHSFRFMQDRKKATEEYPDIARWNGLLDNYNYGEMDAFDTVIFDAVSKGYLDPISLKEQASLLQKGVDSRAGYNERRLAWRLFHDSLSDNEDEVVQAFTSAFGSNVETLRAGSLAQALELLRDLGHNIEADELIALYCDTHDGELDAFDVTQQQEYNSKIEDKKLLDEMDARYRELSGQVEPLEALLDPMRTLGRRYDYERASAITIDELKTAFTTLEGEELKLLFSRCFEIAAPASFDEGAKELRRKGKEALALVAKSSVNKLRLKRWGYSFEGEDSADEL